MKLFNTSILASAMLVTGLMSSTAFAKNEQMGAMAGCMPQNMQAKMQEHRAAMQKKMDEHHAKLKADLKLTPAQEPAWNTFVNTMHPPAPPARMPAADCDKVKANMKANMSSMSKPERMEKQMAKMDAHKAEMQKHLDAMKIFYSQLTPEQQKVFDAEKMPMPKMGMKGMKHEMKDMHDMSNMSDIPKPPALLTR